MRARGQVLLVSCYELGHQPLAVASALGFLARAGFDAEALDLAVEPLDESRVRAARFIGLATPMHTALRVGVQAAAQVREMHPEAHICFFGMYALANAAMLLAGPADSVVGGEVEAALVGLVERLDRGLAAEGPGVATRLAPEPRAVLERLDFATPRRDRLPPLERYAPLVEASGERRVAGYIEASRGCLHHCRHCPIVPVYDGRLFVVPAAVVCADAAQQVDAGATHLTFGDPDFLNAPTHSLKVLRALHREYPRLTFDVTAKVEHLLRHARLLPELAALGCVFVVSAVESLSDTVLAKLDKGHTRADVDRALTLLDRAGLALRPSFVPFTPWTTLADYEELIDWIEDNGMARQVDPIQLAIRLLVPPGSRLLEIEPAAGWPGPLDPDRLTHLWTHPDPRLDALAGSVAARVGEAARSGEEPEATYVAIRNLARMAAGNATLEPTLPVRGPRRDQPPRLAEAWFC